MMEEKGQITIEAIIIFGIFILIFVGVSVPLAFKAKDSATDVGIVSDARYATEQIASAANSISTPGQKRTIEVYVPGFTSIARVITTNISANGTHLITTVTIPGEDPHTMNRELYGGDWTIYNGTTGAAGSIIETLGRRYSIVVTWKNITFSAM